MRISYHHFNSKAHHWNSFSLLYDLFIPRAGNDVSIILSFQTSPLDPNKSIRTSLNFTKCHFSRRMFPPKWSYRKFWWILLSTQHKRQFIPIQGSQWYDTRQFFRFPFLMDVLVGSFIRYLAQRWWFFLLMSRRQKTYHAIDQKNDTKIPQVFYAGGPRYDSMWWEGFLHFQGDINE